MKLVGLERNWGTFSIMFYDRTKHIVNSYFVQFSLEDMWQYPHKEDRFNNGSYVCGWCFFYFGKIISDGKSK